MKIYYGIQNHYNDVTNIVEKKLCTNNKIEIPEGDLNRCKYFGDPIHGTLKHILIVDSSSQSQFFDDKTAISITCPDDDLLDCTNERKKLWHVEGKNIEDPKLRLQWIHQHINLMYGLMSEEYPEQLMIVKHLNENATVLELGSNIGRNTCVIATILNDDRRLVTLESCEETAKMLTENKEINGFNFNIEASALSKVPLCQQGWICVPYNDKVPEGYCPVKTISFAELQKKYNLVFDTIVADCEGSLCQIIKSEPDIFANINMVIIENDFWSIDDKKFVDESLTKHGLRPIYSEAGGWGPCFNIFYQVFQKGS